MLQILSGSLYSTKSKINFPLVH
uniref:Uncharacterized protein n=1 Tax=Anguilla anguilla TaxID=7936 RepID=A0A0E9W7R3_ANGAN